MYHGKKTQALETYNSSDKSTITSNHPTATAVDHFAVVCIKAVVAAVKTSKMLEMVCSIHYVSAWCLQIDIATDSYFGRSSWCWAVLSIHLNDYTAKIVSKGLFKSLEEQNRMGIGSVPVYVMLPDTESSNRTSQVVSLEKGYRKEEVDTKMILGVSGWFNNGYRVGVKILYTDIITLLLAHLTRFHRSCDIMVNSSFRGTFCFFNINSSTPNILNLNSHLMISFCVFTGCNLLSYLFNLPKLGW